MRGRDLKEKLLRKDNDIYIYIPRDWRSRTDLAGDLPWPSGDDYRQHNPGMQSSERVDTSLPPTSSEMVAPVSTGQPVESFSFRKWFSSSCAFFSCCFPKETPPITDEFSYPEDFYSKMN